MNCAKSLQRQTNITYPATRLFSSFVTIFGLVTYCAVPYPAYRKSHTIDIRSYLIVKRRKSNLIFYLNFVLLFRFGTYLSVPPVVLTITSSY